MDNWPLRSREILHPPLEKPDMKHSHTQSDLISVGHRKNDLKEY